jgi:hypothetical protein
MKLCGAVVKPERGVCGSGFSRLATVREAVALIIDFQDVNMVGQSIKKCACEVLRTEGAGPFAEWSVGRYDG